MSDIARIAVKEDESWYGGCHVRRLSDKLQMQLGAIMRSYEDVLIIKAKRGR